MAKGLTPAEEVAFATLKRHLFGEEKFVVFQAEDEQTPEFKAYQALLVKRMDFLNEQRLMKLN
jgi:hypothetical protein